MLTPCEVPMITLRMWQEIISPIFPPDSGALLRCKPVVWLGHAARLAPHIASRLPGSHREVIPCHILTSLGVTYQHTLTANNVGETIFERML